MMLNKLWAAIGGTLAMLLHGLLTDDGAMSAYDWVTFAVQGITAALVWYQLNGPRGTINWVAKFVTAAFSAAGAIFLPAMIDGVVTTDEWSKTGIGAATALLVLLIGNSNSPTYPTLDRPAPA